VTTTTSETDRGQTASLREPLLVAHIAPGHGPCRPTPGERRLSGSEATHATSHLLPRRLTTDTTGTAMTTVPVIGAPIAPAATRTSPPPSELKRERDAIVVASVIDDGRKSPASTTPPNLRTLTAIPREIEAGLLLSRLASLIWSEDGPRLREPTAYHPCIRGTAASRHGRAHQGPLSPAISLPCLTELIRKHLKVVPTLAGPPQGLSVPGTA
jgi:hypothetical protein